MQWVAKKHLPLFLIAALPNEIRGDGQDFSIVTRKVDVEFSKQTSGVTG